MFLPAPIPNRSIPIIAATPVIAATKSSHSERRRMQDDVEAYAMAHFGFLVPTGGGEDIPLKKDRILIGRRENCDIVLRFPNVSGQHCRLTLEQGYWFVKDLDSRNGIKVNGYRVARKRLDPGVMLTIAKHQYEIRYNPEELGAMGPPPADDDQIELSMRSSLMERAGLDRRKKEKDSESSH